MKSRHLQLSLPLLAHQQKKKLAGHSGTLLCQRLWKKELLTLPLLVSFQLTMKELAKNQPYFRELIWFWRGTSIK